MTRTAALTGPDSAGRVAVRRHPGCGACGLPAILGYLFVGHGARAASRSGWCRTRPPRSCSPSSASPSCCSPSGWNSRCRACSRCGARCSGWARRRWWRTTAVFAVHRARRRRADWLMAVVVGGAISMSSTAIIMHQLTERAELNRTHGRLAFSMLLFQDLAFVPFLALASALTRGEDSSRCVVDGRSPWSAASSRSVVVLLAGRWLLRPLFQEIAHSRLRELFTLAVLFVVLASAWVSHTAGLSLALGGFLAGHDARRDRIPASDRDGDPAVPRHPARPVLHHGRHAARRAAAGATSSRSCPRCCSGSSCSRRAIAALATRFFVDSWFKAIRTGVVISIAR